MVNFELDGLAFTGINGGPYFHFTEAISLAIPCADQAETDYYWNALTANGGQESQCGWCKDKFGVSWQVVPRGLGTLLSDTDEARCARAVQAMMAMKKLELAVMRRAADGQA